MLDRLTIERAWAAAGPILLGLSGGGDSVALLHLLVEHLGAARVRAIVIDHALRAGSGDDARRALEFAEGLGVAGEIAVLSWPDGAKRAQQSAREARYGALCDVARRFGATTIAVAHTADDQAETVLMRATAGSGWRGLAGMAPIAPAPVWPQGRGIMLARPLLGVRRAELRDALRARGATWIEDPANTNPAFERVRVRTRLAALEALGFDPMRLARLAANLRPRVEQLDREARALIDRVARIEGERIIFARTSWSGGAEVRRRALSALVAAAAGASREPDLSAIAALEARLGADGFAGASLGGAQLAQTGAEIVLSRDAGALRGRADGAVPIAPLPLPAGEEAVWDGRLAITVSAPGWSVVAEAGRPRLAKGGVRLEVGELGAAYWLLEARVQHLLGSG
ncbi:MAG: tRNA lysidine(34) synthetase TilS [Terricaulis sp.]